MVNDQNMPGLYAPPPYGTKVRASHVAAVSLRDDTTMEERVDEAVGVVNEKVQEQIDKHTDMEKLFSRENIYGMLESGVIGGPVLGMTTGFTFSHLAAEETQRREMKELIDQYRDEISQMFNIPPDQVNQEALFLAADGNKGLSRALEKIYQEKDAHPKSNMVAVVGSFVGMGLGTFLLPIPILGTLAGGFAGWLAGDAVGKNMFAPDKESDPRLHMRRMYAKHQKGKMVSARDVFALRVAQSRRLSADIKEQYGCSFSRLSDRELDNVTKQYNMLARSAARDAQLVNYGANIDDLMFGEINELPSPVQEMNDLEAAANFHMSQPDMVQEEGWAQRVGRPAPKQGSWAKAIKAQRAAAQLNGQELNV